jgi:hypothetical protein
MCWCQPKNSVAWCGGSDCEIPLRWEDRNDAQRLFKSHVYEGMCWCEPEISYIDPDDPDVVVFVHRWMH